MAADPDPDGAYGSLLVVRVGRPGKRPVLVLDAEEALSAAAEFQRIAAHDFANPEAARSSIAVRLSALAANETGLEEPELDEPGGPDAGEAALAEWSEPADPVDTSHWCEAAPLAFAPAAELPEVVEQPEMVEQPAPAVPAQAAPTDSYVADEAAAPDAPAEPVPAPPLAGWRRWWSSIWPAVARALRHVPGRR